MVDSDILLVAFVDAIEGVKGLIGERGAGAVLREAGRHSGPKLLESLIGKLPEVIDKNTTVVHFLAGLVEGFVQFMSEEKAVVKPVKAEKGYIEFQVL